MHRVASAYSQLTLGLDGVEAALLEPLRAAAELGLGLAAGHLQVPRAYPLDDPAQLAVADEEPAAEAQAAQRAVQTGEGGLGNGRQGVAVDGQEGDGGVALERAHR